MPRWSGLHPNMFSGILSAMGYKRTATTCTVQLVAYRNLSATTTTLWETLRREAGRCWTDLVQAHLASRHAGTWLTDADLRALTKGGRYCLHRDRKSTRLNSSHEWISYAVFCLKKKKG